MRPFLAQESESLMPEPARAAAPRPAPKPTPPEPTANRMTELKVSGHLMTLEPGLFCVFQPQGSPSAGPNGLPGIRLSLPPGAMGRPDAVSISTFRPDGWLNGGDGAALVRVAEGPAQVLVTIYQAPGAPAEAAPRLQVTKLNGETGVAPAGARSGSSRAGCGSCRRGSRGACAAYR